MRTLCDVCEAAPARLFCAADEAALCLKCDEKVFIYHFQQMTGIAFTTLSFLSNMRKLYITGNVQLQSVRL